MIVVIPHEHATQLNRGVMSSYALGATKWRWVLVVLVDVETAGRTEVPLTCQGNVFFIVNWLLNWEGCVWYIMWAYWGGLHLYDAAQFNWQTEPAPRLHLCRICIGVSHYWNFNITFAPQLNWAVKCVFVPSGEIGLWDWLSASPHSSSPSKETGRRVTLRL